MPFFNLQRNLFLGGKRYKRIDNPVFIPNDKIAWVPNTAVLVGDNAASGPGKEESPLLKDFDMQRKSVEAIQRIEASVSMDEVELARKKFKK